MLKSMQSTSKLVKTFNEFKSHIKNPIDNFIIGFFNNEEDPLYDSYVRFGSKYPDDFKMFHTFEHEEFLKHFQGNITVPNIMSYFHEFIVISNESNYKALNKVKFQNKHKILNIQLKAILLIIIHKNPKSLYLNI